VRSSIPEPGWKLTSLPTSDRPGDRRAALIAGAAIYVLALALRLLPVFVFPSIHYPDEIFQAVEQAHRLVYGTGLVPWEFVYGTRSWLLPGTIAWLMEFARLFGDGPDFYMPVIGITFAALSASSALCAFLWGRRFYGMPGGLVAGAFAALWIDLVYFAPHPLSEVAATHVLVIGAYLALPGFVVTDRERLVAAGFLLGLATLLRIQLAPAAALIALWPQGGMSSLKMRLPWLVAGGAAMAILYGALDAATWGTPFESIWRNIVVNLYYRVSENWGIEPWFFYIDDLFAYWTALAVIVLVLARFGAYRVPWLGSAALVIFAVHSLIGHKEWRFVYPALLLAVLSAGIGLAHGLAWLAKRRNRDGVLPGAAAVAIALVALASGGLATTENYRALWTTRADIVRASALIAHLPDVCGIELDGIHWSNSGGYSLMHRDAPIYWFGAEDFVAHQDAFNIVLAYDRKAPPPFVEQACFGRFCVAQRPGVCARWPMTLPETPPGLEQIAPAVRR